jgi:hypothetical protein
VRARMRLCSKEYPREQAQNVIIWRFGPSVGFRNRSFYLFYLFQFGIITFIQDIHPSPFAEAPLHFFIGACCSEEKTSLSRPTTN